MRPVTLMDLLNVSPDADWAIPHFNVHNPLLARGVVHAAEQLRAPAVLAVGYQSLPHAGMAPLSAYLKALIEESDGMFALHFDPARDLDIIRRALDLGFSSVMFDGSSRPFEENVRLTRQVVEMARDKGASVEAEIGIVPSPGSTRENITFTDPAQAEEFAVRTGVDFLAVSLGSIHGMTSADATLDEALISRLKGIAPLVLHGASGVTSEAMAYAAAHGVRKININTALKIVAAHSIRETFAAKPDTDLLNAMDTATDAVTEKAAGYMRLFHAEGRLPRA